MSEFILSTLEVTIDELEVVVKGINIEYNHDDLGFKILNLEIDEVQIASGYDTFIQADKEAFKSNKQFCSIISDMIVKKDKADAKEDKIYQAGEFFKDKKWEEAQ